MEKSWFKSKTLWINTLLVLGGVITAVAGELALGGTVTLTGIVNIILRVVTKTALVK